MTETDDTERVETPNAAAPEAVQTNPHTEPNPGPLDESPIAAAEAAVAEQKDKLLRLAAEFDNFRKRAAREREHAQHHGQGVVIRGLLEALDDLARFAHLDPHKARVTTVIDGAKLVEQKILKSLAGHGLEVVNPLSAAFDPAVHEAISTVPTAVPEEDNLVAQVFQVGYVFHGQLLRPARVVVKQHLAT
jgi:molecular chaperone GrpE